MVAACEWRATYPFVQTLKVLRERLSPAVGAFFVREVDGDDVVPYFYLARESFCLKKLLDLYFCKDRTLLTSVSAEATEKDQLLLSKFCLKERLIQSLMMVFAQETASLTYCCSGLPSGL